MQTFQVDLKTLLGLVLPYQYCHVVVKKNCGRCLDYISRISLTPSMYLIYSTIVLYDNCTKVELLNFSVIKLKLVSTFCNSS